MKKLMFFLTLVILLSLSTVTFAANSSVSVKNNEQKSTPVSYSYDSATSGEIVKSIKDLMTKLNNLNTQQSVVQTLTITSLSGDNKPVDFKLRLSIPDSSSSNAKPEQKTTPSPDTYNALDYYVIKLTDANGNVLYDDSTVKDSDEVKNYKDIPIGTLNSSNSAENKIINLTISVNKGVKKTNAVNQALRKLDWSIVSDTYNTASVNEPASTMNTSPSPTADNSSKSVSTPYPSTIATAKPSSSAPAAPAEATLKSGDYVVGKDIPAGRYRLTGQGKVSVYTPEDVAKMSIVLKQKGDSSTNGVDEYVLNVADGERLSVENEVTLTPHKVQNALSSSPSPKVSSSPSASPKATSTPKATATPKPSSTSNSSNNSSNTKTNPKTGDTTPITILAIVAGLSLVGVGIIEFKKRRMSK